MTRAAGLLAGALVLGCGAAATRTEEYYVSDSYSEAIGVAAEATVLWEFAGGCKVAGCLPPLRCNAETELCEPVPCGERSGCPVGTHCNDREHVCEP